MISEIYQILLEFDFRNGLLRRRFDGVKYSLKTIENIFYELNLQFQITPLSTSSSSIPPRTLEATTTTTTSFSQEVDHLPEPAQKKARSSQSEIEEKVAESQRYHYLTESEFLHLLQRMNEFDQARELIIKESRDIQKAAKQSIYAIFRQQYQEARKKLSFCQQKGQQLHSQIIEKVSSK